MMGVVALLLLGSLALAAPAAAQRAEPGGQPKATPSEPRRPAAEATPAPSSDCPAEPAPRVDSRRIGEDRQGERRATPEEVRGMLDLMRRSPTGSLFLDQVSVGYQEAWRLRQNVTRLTHDPKHGTQVTFSSGDGRVYLWYPGNDRILAGRWIACERHVGFQSPGGGRVLLPYGAWCFDYGPQTFNPVTRNSGSWECGPAGNGQKLLVEQRSGDVFGLAKAKAPPFALAAERTTMDALLAGLRGAKKERAKPKP